MKAGYRVVDADAHVIEPADLWSRYVEADFRDRAPRHLNLAFSVVTDGVSINTPDRWDPEASPEQLAHRDFAVLGLTTVAVSLSAHSV